MGDDEPAAAKRWIPAIVILALGGGGAWWGWKKGGAIWAGSIAVLGIIFALAMLAWPSATPTGDRCTADGDCPFPWEPPAVAIRPCDPKTGRWKVVVDPQTTPCEVACPNNGTARKVWLGNKIVGRCFPPGSAQCNDGDYMCRWDGANRRWRASRDGVPIEDNLDLERKEICGLLPEPGNWDKVRELPDAILFRRCENESWVDVGRYSGYTCGSGGGYCPAGEDGPQSCQPCGPDRKCNPTDRYSGIYDQPCAKGKRCALWMPTDKGAWPSDGYCNLGSAGCIRSCLPDGKAYADTPIPYACQLGPRCLAYCLWIPNNEAKCGRDKRRWFWPYQAFFFMEDGTMRWLSIDGSITHNKPEDGCRLIIKWDRHLSREGLHRLTLPVSADWNQLVGTYWTSDGDRRSIDVRSAGTLKPQYMKAGRSSKVLRISGMHPYPRDNGFDPWYAADEVQLLVHDNLFGEEAEAAICQYPQQLHGPPLFSGLTYTGNDKWRAWQISDDRINE